MEFAIPRAGVCAAVTENIVALAAIGTEKVAHVFHDTEHGNIYFAEHGDRFDGIEQSNILRCAHDDSAGERQQLRQCQGNVAGAGWHINNQVIKLTPVGVAEQLCDRAV